MSHTMERAVGTVVSLWRYPVKSMMGEELNASDIGLHGLLGDRAYALVDPSNGKLASVKHPRKWGTLFDCRAAFAHAPEVGAKTPEARITLPDGRVVSTAQPDVDEVLSGVLGRPVRLTTTPPAAPGLEEYWPDMAGLAHRDAVTDEATLTDTFFDGAVLHLLTTSTIDRLRDLYPSGRFEARRFRPNLVLAPRDGETGFVENGWVGHTLTIGEQARMHITGACPRCVMTTLAQGDLPADPGILRTAAQHNDVSVGVYARVLQPGRVHRGDRARVE